ncbi:MAG: ABC transporter substrate-binding protein [Nannocystaceae bacterium]|nr:ABC transporter substrate-binding protein [Nannocystaceae bacterium]
MGASTTTLIRTAGFVLGIGGGVAGGCSLTTLEVELCSTDGECAVSLGVEYLCAQDGYCRTRPEMPGRCDGVIEVRIFTDLSGPFASVGVPYFKGQIDLLREINDEGGIRGCPIVVKSSDHASDSDAAQDAYNGWVGEPGWTDVVTVFGFGPTDIDKFSLALAQQEIVNVTGSYSGEFASPRPVTLRVEYPSVDADFDAVQRTESKESPGYPFNFFAGTDDSTAGRAAMTFVNNEGAAKVAFFACDEAACKDPIPATKQYAADGLGLAVGRDLEIDNEWTQAQVSAAVMGFFEEELARRTSDPSYTIPGWVWVGNPVASAATIGIAVGRVRDELSLEVQVIVNRAGFDESLAQRCNGGCIDYVFGVSPTVAYGGDAPGMDRLEEIHDKWRELEAEGDDGSPKELDANGDPRAYEHVRYVQGHVSVLMWREAMERVVDHQKKVNGASLRDVLEGGNGFTTAGLSAALSFSSGDHRPQSTVKIYKVTEGGGLLKVPPDATVSLQPEWLGW